MLKTILICALGMVIGATSALLYLVNAFAYRELEAANRGYIKIGSNTYTLTKQKDKE